MLFIQFPGVSLLPLNIRFGLVSRGAQMCVTELGSHCRAGLCFQEVLSSWFETMAGDTSLCVLFLSPSLVLLLPSMSCPVVGGRTGHRKGRCFPRAATASQPCPGSREDPVLCSCCGGACSLQLHSENSLHSSGVVLTLVCKYSGHKKAFIGPDV